MDKEYWNKQLDTAISKYDFDLMKESMKNGAEPDNMILHRVINHDKVDLVDYFCFSNELKAHCDIDYKFEYFGDNTPFIYACSCGAIRTLKFMLTDARVSHKFNMEKNAYRGFIQACVSYRLNTIDFLLNFSETKNFCKIQNNNFEIVQYFDKEERWYKIEPMKEVVEYFIMNLDFSVVQEMKKYIVKHKDLVKTAFDARELHESLNNDHNINNKNSKLKKI
jgi:hypothetical protein